MAGRDAVAMKPSGAAAALFSAGAAALFWELALIRWMGSTVRLVAYFTNFVLLAAFLGLGAGSLLARFSFPFRRLLLPALSVVLVLAPVLGNFEHGNPASGEFLWDSPGAPANLAFLGSRWTAELPYGLVLAACFLASAAVFLVFGAWLGELFRAFRPLKAYTIEVAGSLLGITLFGLLCAAGAPPTAWFAAGLLLLWPLWSEPGGARVLAALGALAALAFCWAVERQFLWSPYYKISVAPISTDGLVRGADGDLRPERVLLGHSLTVNNDYHQRMLDLRAHLQSPFHDTWRALYERPYAEPPDGPVLIVGAGSGNDVSAALRRTGERIDAVEIDPGILDLGRRLHPERPYSDPRVHIINTDARSHFARTGERYGAVVFGILDSHTLLSSFSTLRLDNFVYTRESLERVREILLPGGRVYLTFGRGTDWIHARLKAMLDSAFGAPSEVFRLEGQSFTGAVLYANRKRSSEPAAAAPAPDGQPTDDWPFLYLRERGLPRHYRVFLLLLGALSAAPLALLPAGRRRISLHYFFLGAGFFLIETSNVVRLSLLYGSTWMVNVTVFAGILALVLLGNATAARLRPGRLGPLFALLCAWCALAWLIGPDALLPLRPAWAQGAAAALIFLGPVFVAALIFAALISAEPELYPAYGSNLLGAMLGGAAEYFSLVLGFRALALLALAFYGLAYAFLPRKA